MVLLAVAIFGYLAGYHRAPVVPAAVHRETTRTVSGASVLLEYPAGWQPSTAIPAIPGLPLAHPLSLVPGGDTTRAGLLSGQLPGGEPGPLPGRFLALLRGIPHTEVVNLIDGQAYRYSRLSLPGYDRAFDLYVILYAGKSPTALACYAAKASSEYLSQCEQIVAGLMPLGQSSTYDLTPDTGYASRLGTLIEGLNEQRLTLRREMRAHASPAAVGRFAATLADRFTAAAGSLATLEPPPVVGPTQTVLASSILRARDTYKTLAAASTAENQAGYDAALKQVSAAETGVDTALEGFALLGYSQA
ncbi:MAG: hypothetical protein WB709_12430 [Solirubrobacteraceae bacterium]